ncbi:protein canopy homolog 2 isoform X1 [Colius striatus]|uniref:protein canopy homolog 2 isoform X1 n=1 Tax=Colius striatus TaxID=57412 RepID=UPI002B1CEE2C|nr:protein canopy homolog 2 isoform X1 [Colius striatus]
MRRGRVPPALCLAAALAALLPTACARRSQDLHCGACRALVDELEWEIARVDPRKTIQMGSFRINPDGSQSVVEVPYARSEAHLTELLEKVCEKMKEYGEKVDPSTHRKSYIRVISHDGTKMDLSGVKIDGDVTSSLKFATCVTTRCTSLTTSCDTGSPGCHLPTLPTRLGDLGGTRDGARRRVDGPQRGGRMCQGGWWCWRDTF